MSKDIIDKCTKAIVERLTDGDIGLMTIIDIAYVNENLTAIYTLGRENALAETQESIKSLISIIDYLEEYVEFCNNCGNPVKDCTCSEEEE